MMRLEPYALRDLDALQTPALVYYRDIIEENTRRAIEVAGGADRLWPHVKSHKMEAMIRMQRAMGIDRFKCATIAEAQMVAECGGQHILLAYPLVGPNIDRYARLMPAYPASQFYAIGDDIGQLALLSRRMQDEGMRTMALVDVNMGMNRTGVALSLVEDFYAEAAALPGLEMVGLHCYDGHLHQPDIAERTRAAQAAIDQVHALRDALSACGLPTPLLIMGGTPTFPVHARSGGVYLSPGTVFLYDAKCLRNVSDVPNQPAAGIWTRVISHPADGLFTLDLGSKGISTDQPDARGMLVGLEGATPVLQSEEHWVWRMPQGQAVPAIGACFFVVPMHICPTTALYPFAHVASGGELVDRWIVTARDRSLGL